MCLSSGCGQPDESHGNEDHITMDDLQRAADAAETTPRQAAQNMLQGIG